MGKARAQAMGALNFPLTTSGLAKDRRRQLENGCKFASVFMAASLLRGRQARLPIYEP